MDDERDHLELETTQSLIRRVRRDDSAARERLVRRYLPALYRYASGRLPQRDLAETGDAVHDSILRAIERLDGFESEGPGSFLRYLKVAVDNRIRDAWRREYRRRDTDNLDEDTPDQSPTPLDQAVGADDLRRYRAALSRLGERDADAVIMRLELDLPYGNIARQLDYPSANAARMAVTRALKKLGDWMEE